MWLEDVPSQASAVSITQRATKSLNEVCTWVIAHSKTWFRIAGSKIQQQVSPLKVVLLGSSPPSVVVQSLVSSRKPRLSGSLIHRLSKKQKQSPVLPVNQQEFEFVLDEKLGRKSCTQLASQVYVVSEEGVEQILQRFGAK